MNKSIRVRLTQVVLVACLSAMFVALYKGYSAFYNHILEKSEAWHMKVEEISNSSPVQLRITTEPPGSAPVIRSVTIKRRDDQMTVLNHLALAGLAKPSLNWGELYILTVPDSVSEVCFGRESVVIWRRSASAKRIIPDRASEP